MAINSIQITFSDGAELVMSRDQFAAEFARFLDTLRTQGILGGEVAWPRCALCRGVGKMENGQYCTCPLGVELERVEVFKSTG